MIISSMFRMQAFIARRPQWLSDELDAQRLAAAPDDLAGATGSRVACKRQPPPGREHVRFIDGDLGAGAGNILHDTAPRRKTTFESDPAGLTQ
jgi:hypothetical protein